MNETLQVEDLKTGSDPSQVRPQSTPIGRRGRLPLPNETVGLFREIERNGSSLANAYYYVVAEAILPSIDQIRDALRSARATGQSIEEPQFIAPKLVQSSFVVLRSFAPLSYQNRLPRFARAFDQPRLAQFWLWLQ